MKIANVIVTKNINGLLFTVTDGDNLVGDPLAQLAIADTLPSGEAVALLLDIATSLRPIRKVAEKAEPGEKIIA